MTIKINNKVIQRYLSVKRFYIPLALPPKRDRLF
jgi:hypothetical protein